MSVLKKIRENVGLVIVIIALSLFAFIISSVSDKFGSGQDNTVGEVNGNSIDYAELNAKFELAQRNNPNATATAEQYQLKEQAWQSLVREIFYGKEWKDAGIGISDDEVMMMFTGQIYHPYVIQSGYFSDSLGQFNPARVQPVLQQAEEFDLSDPNLPDMYRNYKQGLLDLRNVISLDRRSNKWQAAIKGSSLVSDNELKWGYEQSSRTADINFVYVPYATIPDEQVQVTDGDRSEFFNKHRESYKRVDDEVMIKYVYFTVMPSRLDSADTKDDLIKLIPDFLASTTPFEFANSGSDDDVLDTIPKPLGELPPALVAVQGRTDTVVGPIMGANGFQLLRVVKTSEDTANANVKIRHIVVGLRGNTAADSVFAKAKADSLAGVVRADKSQFAAVALVASDDATRDKGGEMGWLPENALGPEFDKAVKANAVGSIFVTTTTAGYHVVELLDRSNKLYSYAAITRFVNAGNETNDSIFKLASAYHGDMISGGIMSDSSMAKYPAGRMLKSGIIGPGTYTLMGLDAGRAVVCWAFKSEQGQVCEKMIEADNAFVIAKVEYKGNRGYATVDGLKENVEFEFAVRNWVKAKKIKEKLASGGADLQAMAAAYGVGATTGEARSLRMSSSEVQGIGQEPKVVGRAFGLQPNGLSKPIAGNSGVFVVKLIAIQEPAPMDEINKMIQTQMLGSAKTEKTITALFNGMRELAEIRDMRYKADF